MSNLAWGSVEQHTCKNGAILRRVELKTEGESTKGTCKVVYYKDTEVPGSSQELWTANTGSSYCQQKRDGFIEKLTGLGWTCSTDATASAAPTTSGEKAPTAENTAKEPEASTSPAQTPPPATSAPEGATPKTP